jgi:hypothetical protein
LTTGEEKTALNRGLSVVAPLGEKDVITGGSAEKAGTEITNIMNNKNK